MLRYPIPRGSPAGTTSPVESSSREPRAANRRSNASGLGDLGGAEAEGEEEEEDGGGDGVGTFLVENSSSLVRDFAVRPSR